MVCEYGFKALERAVAEAIEGSKMRRGQVFTAIKRCENPSCFMYFSSTAQDEITISAGIEWGWPCLITGDSPNPVERQKQEDQ